MKKSSGVDKRFANPKVIPVILKRLSLSAFPVVASYKNCFVCDNDVENCTGFLPPNQGSENEKL